jgi:AraC family transcriptional regulator
MNQLEWATLHRREVGGIEVQLRHLTTSEPLHFYSSYGRADLSLMLPPYSKSSAVQVEELGDSFYEVGNLSVALPHTRLQFKACGQEIRSVNCLFDADLFRSVTRISETGRPEHLLSSIDIGGRCGEIIDSLLRRIAQEVQAPGFASDTLIEGLGLTALAELARHFHAAAGDQLPPRGRLSVAQMRMLHDYVENRPGAAPTISELARQCGIGPRHFMALFRATTGQTVRQWVDAQRIAKARRLLTQTRIPLKVIAFDLGFANQSVFSTAFKRLAGVSPREYRNREN